MSKPTTEQKWSGAPLFAFLRRGPSEIANLQPSPFAIDTFPHPILVNDARYIHAYSPSPKSTLDRVIFTGSIPELGIVCDTAL